MRRVLVASALVHVAIFASLARSRPAAPAPVVAPAVVEELAVEIESAPRSEPMAAPEVVEPARAAVLDPRAGASSRGTAPAMAAASAAPASSAGTEPIAGGNTDWVVQLGPGLPGTSPSSAGPWQAQQRLGVSRQQMEAEERAAQGPRKDSGLSAALRAQDAAKGLGPDGPVLRALEEETRTSLAPVRGNATFRAIVDATGTVTALHMLESTGDTQGWDDARQRALAALQKKKLDVRGTNGALIDIRIESELRYPSGGSSRAGAGVQDGRLTLSGDLSDLGSKPQRVIHARLSNYTPL